MTARSLTEAGGDSLESDPASRAPWPLPTHSVGERPTTGIVPRHLQRVTMPGPDPLQEVITWVPVEQAKPEAMLTVLMWTGDPEYPYENGYWDGERWRADSHGGEPATPTHWAQVEGPQ